MKNNQREESSLDRALAPLAWIRSHSRPSRPKNLGSPLRFSPLASMLLVAAIAVPARGQQPSVRSAGDTTAWTATDDHRQMMQQLGITALRPGPSGNDQGPNCAHSDASQPIASTS